MCLWWGLYAGCMPWWFCNANWNTIIMGIMDMDNNLSFMVTMVPMGRDNNLSFMVTMSQWAETTTPHSWSPWSQWAETTTPHSWSPWSQWAETTTPHSWLTWAETTTIHSWSTWAETTTSWWENRRRMRGKRQAPSWNSVPLTCHFCFCSPCEGKFDFLNLPTNL